METQIASREDALRLIESKPVRRVYVGVCDIQGQLRAKSTPVAKFRAMLEKGLTMPPILPATDFTDVVHPVRLDADAARLGDGPARIVPETCRAIPWEPADANLLFLAELTGEAQAFDPRALYRRVEARANEQGFRPLHACEYEATLLRETHESVHAKSFRDLEPFTRDSNLYGLARHSAQSEFWTELVSLMEHLGIPMEECHWELAPGAVEVVMDAVQGVRAADNAAIYKCFAKSFAARRGLMLSFMARLSHEIAGNSGHVHISLLNREGVPVFFDASREHNLGETAGRFIGGLQRFLPELALMLLPNVNSWRRLDESSWSFDPRFCSWAIDNRSAPIRVLPGDARVLHLECRIPGADANPYLALACVLAAGLRGIEQGIEPTDPVEGNTFGRKIKLPKRCALPQTMAEAIERFRGSRFAREAFGAEFVRVFAETRAAQEREFRNKVSEWELRRFLELS
jgi:glutamine synthetase